MVNLHYTPTVFSPDGIVVIGTLVANTCQWALGPLSGTTAFIGVPCRLNPTLTALQPDGGFVYRHPTTQRIFAAVPDQLSPSSSGTAWAYPTTIDNDLDLTPNCTVNRFVVRPSGGVVGQCANGQWMEGSTTLSVLNGENVVAFARTGAALVARTGGVVLIAPGGAVTPVNLPFTPTTKMTRSTPTGFYAVQTTPTCSLYSIALNGTATKVGDYTDTGVQPPICNGRLDAAGNLYFGLTSVGGSRIVKRPLVPGMSTDAFTNTMSTNWNLGTFSIILDDGNGITTAP